LGITGGDVGEVQMRSEAWQAHTVAAHTFGMCHPAGTCRMGSDPDTGAVVNPAGSIYGVEGMSIADASIIPCLPGGRTNLPVMMLAERIVAVTS
jgi:5-(hydroxymethyl)furfural/furfural oxidase